MLEHCKTIAANAKAFLKRYNATNSNLQGQLTTIYSGKMISKQ